MRRDKYGDLDSEDSEDFEGLDVNAPDEVNVLNFEYSNTDYHPYDKEFKEDIFGDDEDDDLDDIEDNYFVDEEDDWDDDEEEWDEFDLDSDELEDLQ